MFFSSAKSFVFLLLLGATLVPSDASLAQPAGGSACDVGVRLIEGSGGPGASLISPELESVRAQLTRLPFSQYRALGYQTKRVGVETEELFKFTSSPGRAFDVKIIPHQSYRKKVPVTVRWTDGAGKQLVATRLRILNGGGVVLGTDLESSSSLLISLTCHCSSE